MKKGISPDFIFESVKVAIDEKLGISFSIDKSILKEGLEALNEKNIMSFGSVISKISRDIITGTFVIEKELINNPSIYKENYIIKKTTKDILNEATKESKEPKKGKWIVEFNETSSHALLAEDFSGKEVTKELIEKLKVLDATVVIHNHSLGHNPDGSLTDDFLGYHKYFFDYVIDDKVIDTIRIDIGDGSEVNKPFFDMLEKEPRVLQLEKDSLQESIKDDELIKNKEATEAKENEIIKEAEENKETVKEKQEQISFDSIGLQDTKEVRDKTNSFFIAGNSDDTSINENDEINKATLDNFIITNEVQAEKLSQSERLNNNLEAISMLKRIKRGERKLDITAQEVMAKYVGWGGLADVFNEEKGGQYKEAREFLKVHLTEAEYKEASASTLTAFYTPKNIIDAMYKGLSNLGFKGGKVLEPSLGIGNFIGNLPSSMKETKFYGTELDLVSGSIAKMLYPKSDINIQGFEESKYKDDFFDVAIGNVPFGEIYVNDKRYNKENYLIHDYFFAKSIDKLRDGAVLAFISSSGTLDKKDTRLREHINSKCDFLGAIRLPNTAFKSVAGTSVTSDIIFLQKNINKEIGESSSFLNLATDENGLTYNEYFVNNPNMVIGNMREVSGRFGKTLTCVLDEALDFNDKLDKAIKNIKGEYKELGLANEIESINTENTSLEDIDIESIKNFSYTLIDDKVYFRENDELIEQSFKKKSDKEKVIKYIELTKALNEAIKTQLEDVSDSLVISARENLNKVYDDFKAKYDYLNGKSNTRLLKEDSNFPLVSSIEKLEDGKFKEKADIFFKRTIAKTEVITKVETPSEALILSMREKGRVDLEYIKDLLSKDDIKEVIELLKGQIYLDVKYENYSDKSLFLFNDASNGKDSEIAYVTADEYLTGNVRKKLEHINRLRSRIISEMAYIKDDDSKKEMLNNELKELDFQQEALENAMPSRISASDISARLGASWIPSKYIDEFMYGLLKTPSYYRYDIKTAYDENSSVWEISKKRQDINNDLARMSYGTSRVSAYELIELALNLKEVKVHDKDADGNKILNKKETLLASQKMELIKEEFKSFIFDDAKRRKDLEDIYNERFNSIASSISFSIYAL